MMTERTILHCDLNNFYASVECKLNPSLKNVPVAVCGDPKQRHGIVLAKNQLAKGYGIKTGDVFWEAKQKCPELVCVSPHFDLYEEYSNKVFELYTNYTDLVEPFGSDECWLDVTGCTALLGSGKQIADTIREEVKAKHGLTLSAGVSFNKIFAKLGSDMKKPDATTVIDRLNYKSMIYNLPAEELTYVGRATIKKLHKLNIRTIGDLAAADERTMREHFGINGIKIMQYAQGNDAEPVRQYYLGRKIDSVGHGMTTVRDIKNAEDLKQVVLYLSDLVAARLRKYGYKGKAVSISYRSDELVTLSRQSKMPVLTYSMHDIASAAMELFCKNWSGEPPLRTVTISVFDLEQAESGAMQISIFDPQQEKKDRLDKSIDTLRKKYGRSIIMPAAMMGKDFFYDKSDSEDFLPFKR